MRTHFSSKVRPLTTFLGWISNLFLFFPDFDLRSFNIKIGGVNILPAPLKMDKSKPEQQMFIYRQFLRNTGFGKDGNSSNGITFEEFTAGGKFYIPIDLSPDLCQATHEVSIAI